MKQLREAIAKIDGSTFAEKGDILAALQDTERELSGLRALVFALSRKIMIGGDDLKEAFDQYGMNLPDGHKLTDEEKTVALNLAVGNER